MNKGRKISGGKYHAERKSKLYEKVSQNRIVVLGETKRKQVNARSRIEKTVMLKSDEANIMVDGKAKKAKITNVEETPQNKFFARSNILLKGAIIQTSLGKAKITNRPSQEGMINAILIK